MKKILIVEDDQLIAELERDFLEAKGYEVDIAFTGTEGMEKALAGNYDAAILDVMLPGESGFNICRELRKKSHLPILFVTAKKDDIDKVRGFGLGADDYMEKPFSPTELVARLEAHIQIHERLLQENPGIHSKKEIHLQDVTIHLDSRRVFRQNQEIIFTAKEFDVLAYLSLHPDVVISKEVLFEEIWGLNALGDLSTITVHINRIREKLNEIEPPCDIIQTVWGAGYRIKPN